VLSLQGNPQRRRFGHYLCHQRIQFLLGLEIRCCAGRRDTGRLRGGRRTYRSPAGTAGQQEQ
jgi:hypothetical protein